MQAIFKKVFHHCIPGITLEIGAGSGGLKSSGYKVVSTDIKKDLQWILSRMPSPYLLQISRSIILLRSMFFITLSALFVFCAKRSGYLVPGDDW